MQWTCAQASADNRGVVRVWELRTGVPHAGGSEGARCAGNEACEQLDPASPERVYSLSESEAIARPW